MTHPHWHIKRHTTTTAIAALAIAANTACGLHTHPADQAACTAAQHVYEIAATNSTGTPQDGQQLITNGIAAHDPQIRHDATNLRTDVARHDPTAAITDINAVLNECERLGLANHLPPTPTTR